MSEPGDTKRMGKGMLWVFWCLVLAALAFYFSNLEGKRYNPNQNVSSLSSADNNIVELQRNAFGHYVTTDATVGRRNACTRDAETRLGLAASARATTR